MTANYVPRHFKTVNVLLSVNDAEQALRFYNDAFSAEITEKLIDSNGIIRYAEFKIDDTVVMLTEDKSFKGGSGITLQIYTGDAERMFETAINAGAEEVSPIHKQFFGDRSGKIRDPFGHEWVIATHFEDVPPNELKRRFDEMFS